MNTWIKTEMKDDKALGMTWAVAAMCTKYGHLTGIREKATNLSVTWAMIQDYEHILATVTTIFRFIPKILK